MYLLTYLPDHVNVLYVNTLEDTDLPDETTAGLKRLLHDHQGTFAKSSTDLGFCPIVQHDIDTGDNRPIKQSPRRPPISARDAEDEILDEMLEAGVIEPSRSEWASPVYLVKKKDGTYRFCIDYRRVNAVSRKDAFPIPDIQDALDNLRGSKYISQWTCSVDTGSFLCQPVPKRGLPFAQKGACFSLPECHSACLVPLGPSVDSCPLH